MSNFLYNNTNHYPFGSLLPGRYSGGNEYRYSFQGQEMDEEIKGEGNSIAFKYRIHDPRLGRFLSLDPLSGNFPWNSPYSFSMNRVIDKIELEGAEISEPAYKKENGGYVTAIDQVGATVLNQKQIETQIAAANYKPPTTAFGFPIPPEQAQLKQGGLLGTPEGQQTLWMHETYGDYLYPRELLKKAVSGQEITWSDIGVEVAGIIPIGKVFGKVGKLVSKSEFGEGAVKELANFFKMNANESIEVIQKRLSSTISKADTRIAKHKEWIADPTKKYGADWNDFTDEKKGNIIHHWKQDIKRAEAQKEVTKAALEEIK